MAPGTPAHSLKTETPIDNWQVYHNHQSPKGASMANTSTRPPPGRLPRLDFSPHYRRRVRAEFTGALMSSDGGGLLLGEVDRVLGVIDRLARCFADHRNQGSIAHSLRELLAQRMYGIALGYEDLSDHDSLGADPVLAMLVGKRDIAGGDCGGRALASSATLGRLERSRPADAAVDRYRRISADLQAMDDLLLQLFLEAHRRPPREIVLDLDATDDPLHGWPEPAPFRAPGGQGPWRSRASDGVVLALNDPYCRPQADIGA